VLLLEQFAGKAIAIRGTEPKGASGCSASQLIDIGKRLQLLWD
jgi:hypothetical protein